MTTMRCMAIPPINALTANMFFKEYVKNGKLEHLVKNIHGGGKQYTGHEDERTGKKIKDLYVNMIQGPKRR